jgi:hypothetical protein
MIGLSSHSKLAMAAVGTLLVVSACGVGSEAAGMTRTDRAAPATSDWVSPAGGSSVQDMQDLYALKKQVAALRRGRADRQATVSGVRCNALDHSD